jgi:mRNA deadenylase 3'-5' endonuclease subunit Ccr4
MDFSFRGPRIIEEIRQSDASIVCLQELDRIDDFYDEELKMLGYRVVYGKREGRDNPLVPEHHTIAIAFKDNEWLLIDYQLIDLADAEWMKAD